MSIYHFHIECDGDSDPEQYGEIEPYVTTAQEVIDTLKELGFSPEYTVSNIEAAPDDVWNNIWERPTDVGVLHVAVTKISE